jgi:hypothetical protein
MPDLQPIDGDPFSGTQTVPVNGDPFSSTAGSGPLTPQDYARAGQVGSEIVSTWPARTATALYTAAMAPGDYMQGKLTDEEAQQQAFNLAGFAMTGGLVSGVERGAGEAVLGSGPIKTVPIEGDPFQPIIAYHGSPHDFDAFDMSKIGTGEGAQAYGHGLYFAGNEKVAQQYRDNLATAPSNPANDIAKYWLEQSGGNSASADAAWRQFAQASGLGSERIEETSKAIMAPPPGKMYQVQINADPNHFLDWDKLLSEQHPVVQQALQQSGAVDALNRSIAEEFTTLKDPAQATGEDIHSALTDRSVNWQTGTGKPITEEKASAAEFLKQAGIPGIKYLDAGSRTAGDGTRNYVVFDDKTTQILKKYGIGGLGIGTAAALKHFQTQPVQGDPYQAQPTPTYY